MQLTLHQIRFCFPPAKNFLAPQKCDWLGVSVLGQDEAILIEYARSSINHTQKYKHTSTRKLSYRKDDRAMRPVYGCPENFWESV